MATIMTHPIIPVSLGIAFGQRILSPRLIILGIFLSVIPDLDVIAFVFGIPYISPFGHRGFSHSVFAAVIVALLCSCCYRKLKSKWLTAFLYSFISMVSHPLLDALTNGGLGIAFFWPFSKQRYFFPGHIIEVSPIGRSFFSERGFHVMQSEFITVWLPALLTGFSLYLLRKAITRFK